MSLPKQVQRQLEEAAAFDESLKGKPVEVVEAAPAQPVEPAPTEETVVEPSPAPAPAPSTDDDPQVWKQRYKSLQGIFNSQVPALKAEVDELKKRLTELAKPVEVKPTEPETY